MPNRIRRIISLALAAATLVGCWFSVATSAAEAGRAPWTTSQVTGSPEPPPPFRTERVFPNIAFQSPVEMSFAPGIDRFFVVEQYGKIFSFKNDPGSAWPELFIDLAHDLQGLDKVPTTKGVGAVYGLAFHPQFQKNHYCYICYVLDPKPGEQALPGGSRVSRFTVTSTDPPRCDPASEVVLIDWRGGGHNGGSLQFGLDGFLYISTGDGSNPNPPDELNTGQDISDLLASILRIDVDHADNGRNYAIPVDNPFINTPGARPEVWAYGLRNPWRMSFDRATGDLWVGDVGWELWEMVHRISRGGNYGWSVMEGPQSVHPRDQVGPTPIVPPTLALPHTESASITGGFVYRGKRLVDLAGHYVFGDWETRRIWAAKCEADGLAPYRQIAQTDLRVVAFGQDGEGELYVLDYERGGLHRLVPSGSSGEAKPFPRRLSETGLFASTADQTPAQGVYRFEVNASQWNDGATAERFIAIPGAAAPKVQEDRTVFPKDSALVRTFSLELRPGDSASRKRVESQLLHFDGVRWNPYSYRWNDEQTDAELVEAAGGEATFSAPDPAAPGGRREATWRIASRGQCLTCHTSWNGFTLAFNVPQLDRKGGLGGAEQNQVKALKAMGLLPPAPQRPPWERHGDGHGQRPLVDPYDRSADLDDRARSYLQVNCAHCHRFGGGGSALIDVRYELDAVDTHLLGAPPLLGTFGLTDPRIIAAGVAGRSVLLYRTAKIGTGRMPHIGSERVDSAGVALLAEWVERLSHDGQEKPIDFNADLQSLRAGGGETVSPEQSATIDRLHSTSSGALALALALHEGEVSAAVRNEAVSRGSASTQDFVRDLYEAFLPSERLPKRLGTTIDPAKILALDGDADRGRRVFFGAASEGGLCSRCHRVGTEGVSFGPDLSRIGAKYDRAKLLENILEPSKVIDPQFATNVVRTKKGQLLTGLLAKKTDAEIVLKDVQNHEFHVPADQVDRIAPQPFSSMPEALLTGFTAQQAADLLAFVASQK